ncbi:MAG: antibiotic biosynthesis monooxygenase [Chloroflexi bacterium]|nr:antibiotic biosynthesis monooxygenase [Chloroflexota bacterium]
MHVRVTNVQLKPGKMQDLIKAYDDSVVPAQKAQKGYQGSYLMTDASSGKALAISVWETEADLVASGDSGYVQEALTKLADLFEDSPKLDNYELSSDNSP